LVLVNKGASVLVRPFLIIPAPKFTGSLVYNLVALHVMFSTLRLVCLMKPCANDSLELVNS